MKRLPVLLLLLTSTLPAQYNRSEWPHWIDEDHDCLNTRHEVLAAESLIPVDYSSDGCRVISGLWVDPYDGTLYSNPRSLDVDHVVPLAEAYASGGHSWSRSQRRAYANDLTSSHLVATSARLNRQKGARRPDEWAPPVPALRCRYAIEWIGVKSRWGLSIIPSERAALDRMLEECSGVSSPAFDK